MNSLNVLKITTADTSMINFIKEETAVLEWYPGLEDIESFLASDHPGIYVAKLNDEPIGFLSFTKISSDYYTFGMYAIKEKFRGKGYGFEMFRRASQEIDWSTQNVSAYSVPDMIKIYERSGFHSRWMGGWYTVNIPTALESLKQLAPIQGLKVKNVNEVEKQALLSYDTAVFGYQRHNFIWKRLHVKGSHAKVIVNNEGGIAGYVAARVVYNLDNGYRLGPLFADSIEAAQQLMKGLLEELMSSGESSCHTLVIACPTGANAYSKELIELLQGNCFVELAFITTRDIPNGCFEKWFGISSLEIG